MDNNLGKMENQVAVRNTLRHIFTQYDYPIYTQGELNKLEKLPVKYIVNKSRYRSIYGHSANSEFKVFNNEKNISLRIEIKIQKSSGSVDEKFPYIYLNAVQSHEDDVLIILDGGGYKYGVKTWLEKVSKENWLNKDKKSVLVLNVVESIKYLREIL